MSRREGSTELQVRQKEQLEQFYSQLDQQKEHQLRVDQVNYKSYFSSLLADAGVEETPRHTSSQPEVSGSSQQVNIFFSSMSNCISVGMRTRTPWETRQSS